MTTWSPTAATPAAPATGRRRPASTATTSFGWRSAAMPRSRGCSGRSEPAGADSRRRSRSAPAAATTRRRRSASAPRRRRRRLGRHLRRGVRSQRRRVGRPDRHRRRLRRGDRGLPAAGLHAQRRPGARCRARPCWASITARSPTSRSRRPPGPTGWSWCRTSRASAPRTGPTRPASVHGLRLGNARPRRTWPGPRWRACCADSRTGWTPWRWPASRRPRAAHRRRSPLARRARDRAHRVRRAGARSRGRRVRRVRRRPPGRLGAATARPSRRRGPASASSGTTAGRPRRCGSSTPMAGCGAVTDTSTRPDEGTLRMQTTSPWREVEIVLHRPGRPRGTVPRRRRVGGLPLRLRRAQAARLLGRRRGLAGPLRGAVRGRLGVGVGR